MNRAVSKPKHACHVTYGGERIPFSLRLDDLKRLTITVLPDMTVEVKAPSDREMGEILRRVQRRARWIAKQREHFRRFQPLPTERQYVSGETFLYLGRQYRLKVARRDEENVKLKGRYFHVHVADRDDRARIRTLLQTWYRDHAEIVFCRRVDMCLGVASRYGIQRPAFRIRRMRKRWASYTNSGVILLNTELVKAPLYCIDYVILHELCHTKVPNHGRAFQRLLAECLPGWESRKTRLELMVIS